MQKLLNSLPKTANLTVEMDSLYIMLIKAQTVSILYNIFRMDDLTSFSNPAIYVLGNKPKGNFIICYAVLLRVLGSLFFANIPAFRKYFLSRCFQHPDENIYSERRNFR